jgi:chromatin structure-remodeling complex subunit RSC9
MSKHLPENEGMLSVNTWAKRQSNCGSIPFDREGKVSGRPVSLYKLYKLVMAKGGYDKLSAERMQWRTLVKEFGFGKTHEAVMTFQLKTVYYKNLA